MIAVRERVLKNDHRLIHVADDHIGSALVVQVAESGAAAHVLRLKEGARFRRDILEPNLPGFVLWLFHISEQDRSLQKFSGLNRKTNHMAVRDEKILVTVEIKIDESSAKADVIQADGRHAGASAGKYKLGRWRFPRPPGRVAHISVKRVDLV